MTATLVGTVWRDSNWHTFTVTAVEPGTDRGEGDHLVLHGTTSNCTPGVCPWSHEGKAFETVAPLDEALEGRIAGWQRQDLWEKDPYRPAQPHVTDQQRQQGLTLWGASESTPTTDAVGTVAEREGS